MPSSKEQSLNSLANPKNDFNFDYWMKLAQESPEEFEKQRKLSNKAVIDGASDEFKRRGEGLIFQIDTIIKTSKNPMDSCIKLSKNMHESFNDLRDVLNNGTSNTKSVGENNAKILPFNVK